MSLFLNYTIQTCTCHRPNPQSPDSSDLYVDEYGSRALTHITALQKKICPTLLIMFHIPALVGRQQETSHRHVRFKKTRSAFTIWILMGEPSQKGWERRFLLSLPQVTVTPRQTLSVEINSGLILVQLVHHIHEPTRASVQLLAWKTQATRADISPEELLPGTTLN